MKLQDHDFSQDGKH